MSSRFLSFSRRFAMPKRNRDFSKPRTSRPHNERHPSHLKGREIGLFYARKHIAKRKDETIRPLATVLLSETKKQHIRSVLNSFSVKTSSADNVSYSHVQDSSFKREFLRIINERIDDKLEATTIVQDPKLDETLFGLNQRKENDPKFLQMMQKRKILPSFSKREEILKIVEENQIVVISGETGCGKTTQVAQFILDDFIEKQKGSMCRIWCTQPRRISAISVAERVADERGESLGNSVGYQIRLERRFARDRGSIMFCTTGVVLKQMEMDPSLSSVSHLILDEIHERDVMSDFIIAIIKQIVNVRKDLKVILMSATLNSEKFSKYYGGAPHLNIPGFTYPVQEYYLEDVLERTKFVFEPKFEKKRFGRNYAEKREKDRETYEMMEPHIRQLEAEGKYSRNTCIQLRKMVEDEEINLKLILALLVNICEKEKDEGAVLIFVTGFAEISTLHKLISESGKFPPHKYHIYPLHSLMPTVDQKQIFLPPPPGTRKIIIATNIAETSITIDDVVFVIDCGKIKISDFDPKTNTESLAPQWVSLANASQRKGRAGRVRPGICFHLYCKAREMLLEQYQKPEILRKRLEDVILTAKVLQLGKIDAFFPTLIDAPDPEAVDLSLNLLKQMNALTEEEVLTPLGYHLAKLPISPQMGKMILFGAIFSCLDPVLSVAATLDFKDAFQLPLGKEKQADQMRKELANGVKSDHLLFHEVLKGFEESGSNQGHFCWRYFLSSHTLKLLKDMKKQFMEYLHVMNFVSDSNPKNPDFNRNSHNTSLVKAIICAGLYPNISVSRVRGKPPLRCISDGKSLQFHPKSVLSTERYFESNLMVYYRKVKSSRDFVHDATIIYPLPVIFFGDNFMQTADDGHNAITINKNLKFKCSESTTAIIKELREQFNWFLEYKISHPGPIQWGGENKETKILEVIAELITCEDMEVTDDEAFDDFDD